MLQAEINRLEDLLSASRAERDEIGIKYNALSERVRHKTNALKWYIQFKIKFSGTAKLLQAKGIYLYQEDEGHQFIKSLIERVIYHISHILLILLQLYSILFNLYAYCSNHIYISHFIFILFKSYF